MCIRRCFECGVGVEVEGGCVREIVLGKERERWRWGSVQKLLYRLGSTGRLGDSRVRQERTASWAGGVLTLRWGESARMVHRYPRASKQPRRAPPEKAKRPPHRKRPERSAPPREIQCCPTKRKEANEALVDLSHNERTMGSRGDVPRCVIVDTWDPPRALPDSP